MPHQGGSRGAFAHLYAGRGFVALSVRGAEVHGLPSKLMCEDLLPILEGLGFQSTDFDYMYMPLDHRALTALKRKSNLGYMSAGRGAPAAFTAAGFATAV